MYIICMCMYVHIIMYICMSVVDSIIIIVRSII